jgi:hypothetical protein
MTRSRDHRPDERPPGVEIAANARARRVRFQQAPRAEVRFVSGPDEARWRSESRIVEPESASRHRKERRDGGDHGKGV